MLLYLDLTRNKGVASPEGGAQAAWLLAWGLLPNHGLYPPFRSPAHRTWDRPSHPGGREGPELKFEETD